MAEDWFTSYTINATPVLQSHCFYIHHCCFKKESEVNPHWVDPDYSRYPEFKQHLAPQNLSGCDLVCAHFKSKRDPGALSRLLGGLLPYCTAKHGWCWAMPRILAWFVHHKDHPTATLTRPPFFCHAGSPSKPHTENASFSSHLPLPTTLVTIKMSFRPPTSNLVWGKNKQSNKGLKCLNSPSPST